MRWSDLCAVDQAVTRLLWLPDDGADKDVSGQPVGDMVEQARREVQPEQAHIGEAIVLQGTRGRGGAGAAAYGWPVYACGHGNEAAVSQADDKTHAEGQHGQSQIEDTADLAT